MDDIQDGHVAALLCWVRGYHAVLRLQQPSHDVQHGGLAHCLRLFDVLAGEGRVGSHQEMAARGRDQRRYNSNEIVVHVARVSEGRGTRRHDSRDKLVGLFERRVHNVQSVGGNLR